MDGAADFADVRLSSGSSHKPDAVDLSHHLSLLAKSRLSSPLKKLYPYFGVPGMLLLAGGLPSPDYFPFDSVSAEVLVPNSFKTVTSPSTLSWLWDTVTAAVKVRTTRIEVKKYEKNPGPTTIQLSTALQYSQATGLLPLQSFIHTFVAELYRPAYANFETLLCAGSTAAFQVICTTLAESGDGLLCEDYTYPSALATAWPSGIKPVPCPIDGGGLVAEGMEEILANWDVEARGGMKRPTLLYTVPVCQNPTGSTMSVERKKAIYEVCVKYDVIIVEDDPYYALQAGEYSLPDARPKSSSSETDEEFLKSLIPSFLRYDYQGRVVRIDTFSKTICPGSRLGYITSNPIFSERFLRANESSTQAPCGFAQALVAKLLVEEWGMPGWYRWLKGLKAQYRDRRDVLVDNLLQFGGAQLEKRMENGTIELRTQAKVENDEWVAAKTLLSFVPPQGGMFVWLRVHISNHPQYPAKPAAELVMELWTALADHKVLLAPGTIFSATTFGEPVDEFDGQNLRIEDGDGFFRLSFSSATEDEMKQATKIIHTVVKAFFA